MNPAAAPRSKRESVKKAPDAKKSEAGEEKKPAPTEAQPRFAKRIVAYSKDLSETGLEPAWGIYGAFIAASDSASAWDSSGMAVANKIAQGKLLFAPPPALGDFKTITALPTVAADHSRAQVPGATPLYYNVRTPGGGTASAEIDLGTNGTMTKSTSQKADQLPGALVSTTGAVLSAALGSTALNTVAGSLLAPAQQQGATDLDVIGVDVKLVPMRRLYTVTLMYPSTMTRSACGDVGVLLKGSAVQTAKGGDASPCRASLTVEVKAAEEVSISKDGKGKDDGQIQFSGAVKLPSEVAK
jgi:hypothetical protein